MGKYTSKQHPYLSAPTPRQSWQTIEVLANLRQRRCFQGMDARSKTKHAHETWRMLQAAINDARAPRGPSTARRSEGAVQMALLVVVPTEQSSHLQLSDAHFMTLLLSLCFLSSLIHICHAATFLGRTFILILTVTIIQGTVFWESSAHRSSCFDQQQSDI
jgi:hypothetical protein